MFLEMAYIQRFILYLGHPLYAVAVVLCAFLLFAGIGSGLSGRLADRHGEQQTVMMAVAAIALLGAGYLLLLEPLFGLTLALPDTLRILITIILIAPLALFMGMPFPMAMRRLGDAAPQQIPWAWAVNGCASVISAVLATLLAIHFGFTVVVVLALLLYGLAYANFPRQAQ
jgi:MFS family permease